MLLDEIFPVGCLRKLQHVPHISERVLFPDESSFSSQVAFSIDKTPGFELAKIHVQWLRDLTKDVDLFLISVSLLGIIKILTLFFRR